MGAEETLSRRGFRGLVMDAIVGPVVGPIVRPQLANGHTGQGLDCFAAVRRDSTAAPVRHGLSGFAKRRREYGKAAGYANDLLKGGLGVHAPILNDSFSLCQRLVMRRAPGLPSQHRAI
mgnify:FL=1